MYIDCKGTPLEINAHGELRHPELWTEDAAEALAVYHKCPSPMPDAHWTFIRWLRARVATTGYTPTVLAVCRGMNVGIKELYKVYRPGLYTAAKVAGIPRPGCHNAREG